MWSGGDLYPAQFIPLFSFAPPLLSELLISFPWHRIPVYGGTANDSFLAVQLGYM